jgi:hypothetical protein
MGEENILASIFRLMYKNKDKTREDQCIHQQSSANETILQFVFKETAMNLKASKNRVVRLEYITVFPRNFHNVPKE